MNLESEDLSYLASSAIDQLCVWLKDSLVFLNISAGLSVEGV